MFKDNLKLLLNKSGKSQKELAEFVDVKPNTVSDWLNQGNSPKIEHLRRISEFFDVSLDWLLTGEGDMYKTDLTKMSPNERLYKELGIAGPVPQAMYDKVSDINLFIDRVKELCVKNKISVNKALKDCGFKNLIANIKKGSEPSIVEVITLSKYFNVSPDYLLCKTDDPTPMTSKERIYKALGIPEPDMMRVTATALGGESEVTDISREDWPIVKSLMDDLNKRKKK